VRKVVFCLTAALALTSVSCSNSSLYPVVGKVTYKGIPPAGATVFFYRHGVESLSEHLIMGVVQADGSFELVCDALGKGAPAGDYDVVIEWKPVTRRRQGRPQRGPDVLRGRYADPKHPLLHAVIRAETNNLPPFELTGPDAFQGRRNDHASR
jgi:hypothetical protein